MGGQGAKAGGEYGGIKGLKQIDVKVQDDWVSTAWDRGQNKSG